MGKQKIRKETLTTLQNEVKQLYQEVRSSLKTGANNKFLAEIAQADKINVLERIKRDLNKFKTVSDASGGKRLSKEELKNSLKEAKLKEEQERIKNLKPKEKQTFYCTGTFNTITTYNYKTKKNGEQKKQYEDEYRNAKAIEAHTAEEAQEEFIAWGANEYNQKEEDYMGKTKSVKSVSNVAINTANSFKKASETEMYLRAAKPIEYDFFSQDPAHLKNNGFCVVDTFLGVYSPLIKKLDLDYFIKLCYKVRGEVPPEGKKFINLLDVGVETDDDENEDNNKGWTVDKGITPDMINKICIELNITHYAFDITKQCFLKHIGPNRNYPALVYYAINGHMYYLSDKNLCLKLIRGSQVKSTTIRSMILDDDHEKVNIFEGREILENIRTGDLMSYNKCVIIYAKTNLNDELDDIIKRYNYIPSIKNHKYSVTQIKFNFQDKDIILVIDPNDRVNLTYKDVQKLCADNQIEFTNQSFGALVVQLKDKFYSSKSIRHIFTKEERKAILDETPLCVLCEKRKGSQIDHIQPLALGGTNETENLQVLCKECHFEKTRAEQEDGYVKESDTESSFNTISKEIFNSKLNNRWAFIETLKDSLPESYNNSTLYSLDINKCRKNALYYSKYDYPLFTVMDEPIPYAGKKLTGLYFVITDSYIPLRGNGWYSLPMIEYCLENKIIEESDIRYALYSSISIPHDYYNSFINFIYTTLGEYAKLSINCMIGMFKPKERENWKSLLISSNASAAFYHYLKRNAAFIDSRDIGDVKYHQVYESYITNKLEAEAPIYNQVLDLEAIELHKLMTIVKDNKGTILDLNTDAVNCVFPHNIPFTMDEKNNIKGFYYDKEETQPRYKMEIKNERLKVQRLPGTKRNDYYDHITNTMEIINDVEDNNFEPLIKTILDLNKSVNIDGRAGCGKSTLIKMLMKTMDDTGRSYIGLATTNKAARIINGKTIHMFAATCTSKYVKELNVDYIFIDEVSMMHEKFYKFFIMLKKMKPTINFIIAGDFEQLLPVKDRVENCDYKNSAALFELCDGLRLQLSKCRRSDDTLFNMLLPDNIEKLTRNDFLNNICDRHLSFTNDTRIKINEIMMMKYIKQKNYKKTTDFKKLSFDKNSQDMRLLPGMPVIARKNNKKLNIFNNETFTIKEIKKTKEIIIVEDEGKLQEIPFEEFSTMFYIAFCITVHKSQGATYDKPYSIHEFNRFDNRLKYVALSRATNKNLINIV